MNYRNPSAIAALTLVLGASAPVLLSEPVQARNCGGLNQRACAKILPGPPCRRGLKEIRGFCLPKPSIVRPGLRKCGGLRQRACPKIYPGPQCNRGLVNIRGFCLPGAKPDKPDPRRCGGLRQRACPKILPGPQCRPGLVNIRGICLPGARPDKPQARRCGGFKQLPCPKRVRVPACNPGLVINPLTMRCARLSGGSSVANIAKRCVRDFKPMGKAMLAYGLCQKGLGNLNALKRAIKARNANDVRKIIAAARCKAEFEQMVRVIKQKGFRSFSFGVSGELSAGVGVSSEFFVAMNLDMTDATLYQQVGGSLGAQGGIGLNGVVSAFYNRANKLSGGGKSYAMGGKFLGGGGAAVGLSKGRSPRCESFSASAGPGMGANFGSLALTHTHKLFRLPKPDFSPGCKDVKILARNRTGRKIKVVDIDFYDYKQNRWRSKLTRNKNVRAGEDFKRTYKLQKVLGDATKLKVQYRVHRGGLRWSEVKEGVSPKTVCRRGMQFTLNLTRR